MTKGLAKGAASAFIGWIDSSAAAKKIINFAIAGTIVALLLGFAAIFGRSLSIMQVQPMRITVHRHVAGLAPLGHGKVEMRPIQPGRLAAPMEIFIMDFPLSLAPTPMWPGFWRPRPSRDSSQPRFRWP